MFCANDGSRLSVYAVQMGKDGEETPIEMASRHVRHGAVIVVRQKALVKRLRANGSERVLSAESLLRIFEQSQRCFLDDLARIEKETPS
jgi:hypothetical protein